MIYYLFPRSSIEVNVHCKVNYTFTQPSVSYSLSHYNYLKELTQNLQNTENWQKMCDQLSLYNSIKAISKINKSRFFFEILEIHHIMRFAWEKMSEVKSLHMGTGAAYCSWAALEYIRKSKTVGDVKLLLENKHSLDEFISLTKEKNNIAFCEASRNDEYQNSKEFILQICIVLCTQSKFGTCIIKCGDTFSELSLQAITLLSHFYDKTFFLKPSVSDVTSSEKFLVCTDFLFDNINDKMFQTFFQLYKHVLECPSDRFVENILQKKVPMFLWEKLEEINSIFGQPRLEKIHQLLTCAEDPEWTKEYPYKQNAKQAKEWWDKLRGSEAPPYPL